MSRANVTAYMVAHNEGHRLERTLRLLRQQVERIIVVDNGSTDGTIDIANRWADTVYPIVEQPRSRHRHLQLWTPDPGQWILSIDADEELTDHGADLLLSLAGDTQFDCWGLLRLSRVYYRDRVETVELMPHLRLFRAGSIACAEELHTPPWPLDPKRYATTSAIAMLHDKSDWEQRLDVIEYDREGVLGTDAENVRKKWGLATDAAV